MPTDQLTCLTNRGTTVPTLAVAGMGVGKAKSPDLQLGIFAFCVKKYNLVLGTRWVRDWPLMIHYRPVLHQCIIATAHLFPHLSYCVSLLIRYSHRPLAPSFFSFPASNSPRQLFPLCTLVFSVLPLTHRLYILSRSASFAILFLIFMTPLRIL